METIEIKSNVSNLELYSDQYPFNLSLRIKNFENESEMNKFIKKVESMIRLSMEYKLWKNYIQDILQLNNCVITHETMEECQVELHHHIPSLYLIVKALILKAIQEEQEFSSFDIAIETMKLHFQNQLGYVVLLKSIHEKFHNGFLTIPVHFVKGNYMAFIQQYGPYLEETDMDNINGRLSITEANCTWSRDNYPGLAAAGG